MLESASTSVAASISSDSNNIKDQIRSHAQKYFLKVQKNGTSEHVPPSRPKRKAAHPYPQKAPKNAVSSHRSFAIFSCSSRARISCGVRFSVDIWKSNQRCTFVFLESQYFKNDIGLASITNNHSSSSNESNPRVGK